jgi:hypothetical protein
MVRHPPSHITAPMFNAAPPQIRSEFIIFGAKVKLKFLSLSRKKSNLLTLTSAIADTRGWLICGIGLLFLAVGGALTGQTLARYGQIINRSENPKNFWWTVALYFLGGVSLIGYYLYKVN